MQDTLSIKEEPVEGSKKLYIIFGGKNAGIGIPPFEFYNASKILEENKVFVRDFKQSWYHLGLSGISNDIHTTKNHLKQIIERYSPQETILIGNSMGGFAAILFASLLSNCHAIAFAPQTFINPIKRFKHRDKRWNREILRTYKNTLFRRKYFDLSRLCQDDPNWHADIIVSNNHPLDLAHARNLLSMPQVSIHEYNFSGHRIVKELRDRGQLGNILTGNFNANE
jgi:pimeloyl-ACP methyl ester carboxylesterase